MGEEESLAATDVVQSEVISQPHYSNKDIVVPAALLASALLAVFVLSACKVCRRKKDPQLDLLNPCIVVYPSYQGTTPQFLNKDIQFSLPQIRRSESFDELTRDDSEGEPPPLLPRRAQAQRSNSFSCYGLGAIDPTLYQGAHNFEEDLDYPEGHLGRVWFSLRYEVSSEKLLVTLVKVKNLPSRTVGTTNNCDPFVRPEGTWPGMLRGKVSIECLGLLLPSAASINRPSTYYNSWTKYIKD